MCDFTTEKAATEFLHKLSVQEGYDYAEAMELALYKVKQLQWTQAASGHRIIRQVFAVTDAVPHASIKSGDHFPEVSRIPSGLDWRAEADSLKKLGIETHVLECAKMCLKEAREVYQAIAGTTGSVTLLDNANELIAKVTQVVQDEDEIDALIGQLENAKISSIQNGDTDESMDGLATQMSGVTINPVEILAEKCGFSHEAATAKIASHQNRYATTAEYKQGEEQKNEATSSTSKSNSFAFGRGFGFN